MVARCMRVDSSHCDPSCITLGCRSRVIWLGSQFKESFLTHLSTIRFSLKIESLKAAIAVRFVLLPTLHQTLTFPVQGNIFVHTNALINVTVCLMW